jgi:glutaredoxin-related protein
LNNINNNNNQIEINNSINNYKRMLTWDTQQPL